MSRIHTRMSFQPGFDYSYQKNRQHQEPSIQAKKLILFLQSQKGPKIEDKLRQEVFFKKIDNTINETQDSQTNLKQNIIINSSKQKTFTGKNQGYFAKKLSPKGRKGFYSPNIAKQQKSNDETSGLTNFEVKLQTNLNGSLKIPLNHSKKTSKVEKKIIQSEKLITNTKQSNQCPQFLRNTAKTTKKLEPYSQKRRTTIQDFLIIKSFGQGTFGEVFMAFHKATFSVYAIKMYKKEIIKRHELEDKFIHDIKVQLKMNHPNIVKLYGFFDDPINFYMIFEFMESGNLSKFIEQKGGKLTQVQIYRKIFQINDALLYLHEKHLIHRDIKPASVMTCLNVCKLGDTEWLQEDVSLSRNTTLCKELDYMAPEAFEGKQITSEFDIWGLGLIAYQLLTGKKLTQGNTQKILIRKIISLNKELIQILIPKQCSEDLKRFISLALQPVPSKRLKSNEINQMKTEKQKQLTSSFLTNRSTSVQEKPMTISQKIIGYIRKSPPKTGLIFGVKKQIRNEVSTLL